jgi:hypothetical protein
MAIIPKVWTAADVRQGRLYIDPPDENGDLLVNRDYAYEDGLGDVMADFSTQSFTAFVPWASVPQNIRDALTLINTWTYTQILSDEGMGTP